ncbi:MAG: thioredoxin family protein [Pirellulales bacterium]|nr:thioredoxin family protein [Pirellulales bacterium]
MQEASFLKRAMAFCAGLIGGLVLGFLILVFLNSVVALTACGGEVQLKEPITEAQAAKLKAEHPEMKFHSIPTIKFDEPKVVRARMQLVSYGARWCDSCRRMEREFAAIERKGYRVLRIDIDSPPRWIGRYRPHCVPHTSLYIDRVRVKSWNGYTPARTILQWLRDYRPARRAAKAATPPYGGKRL